MITQGRAELVDCLRGLDVADVGQSVEAERVLIRLDQGASFVVVAFGMVAEDARGIRRERAVHEDRQRRKLHLIEQRVEVVDEALRTAHAERGDQDLAAALEGLPHDLAEARLDVLARRMEAIAVR